MRKAKGSSSLRREEVRGVAMPEDREEREEREVTVYLQGDDALALERGWFCCDRCLVNLNEVYLSDRFGNYVVFGDFDRDGNLVGLFCPACAETVNRRLR